MISPSPHGSRRARRAGRGEEPDLGQRESGARASKRPHDPADLTRGPENPYTHAASLSPARELARHRFLAGPRGRHRFDADLCPTSRLASKICAPATIGTSIHVLTTGRMGVVTQLRRAGACARPEPARPRDRDRAGSLAGPVGGLFGAAHHRAADPRRAAGPADLDAECLGHPGPALARPDLPAGRHRLRPGAGAAGALPAEPHQPRRLGGRSASTCTGPASTSVSGA